MTAWDTSQIRELKRLADENKTADKIARIMGRSPHSIWKAARRWNITLPAVSERRSTSIWSLPEELQRQAIAKRAAAAARRQRQQNEADYYTAIADKRGYRVGDEAVD